MELRHFSNRFATTPLRCHRSPEPFITPRIATPTSLDSAKAISFKSKVDTIGWKPANCMFILGMGFVGEFVGEELKEQGWVVSGSCTSVMKKKRLEEMGFNMYLFDANEPELEVLNTLRHYTHLLISIPPLVGIGDPLHQHKELLRNGLSDGNLQWLCYLSSTSVYGNCGGAWVDEDCPLNAVSESAKARLAAEKMWLNLGHELGISTQIFRLGGVYGPGRSAVDTILKKEPLSDSQKMRFLRQYTSRVHVADICQAVKASIRRPSFGKIYNVVDDDPAPRAEVFAFARDLIEQKWPGRFSPQRVISSLQMGSSKGEKRVSNACLKKELGVRLHHPDYKSGLRSIIYQMENPF